MARKVPAGKHPLFKGWPRRKLPAEFVDSAGKHVRKMLPNLWIGGQYQLAGNWVSFHPGREAKAVKERLCVVCGEKMEGTVVYGRYFDGSPPSQRGTDGPAGHPRCIYLAVNTCPHFTRSLRGKPPNTIVAFAYDGNFVYPRYEDYGDTDTSFMEAPKESRTLNRAQLKQLAQEKPLG